MKSLRYVIPLAIFLALCALFYSTLDRDTQLLPSPLIGKTVPQFSLPRLITDVPAVENTTKEISIIQQDSYQGKKWLLNIWASWCAACRIEHPLFNKLNEQTDWHLVGLNYKDKEDEAKQWLEVMHNPYQDIIFDKEGSLGLDLGVYGVPETFLIDEQGIVQYKHVGPVCEVIIDQIITPFFENKAINMKASC